MGTEEGGSEPERRSEGSRTQNNPDGEWAAQRPEATGTCAQSTEMMVQYRGAYGAGGGVHSGCIWCRWWGAQWVHMVQCTVGVYGAGGGVNSGYVWCRWWGRHSWPHIYSLCVPGPQTPPAVSAISL